MSKINTNWSTPKTNIFSALLSLKAALTSGYNARLIKMRNEDCQYPIKNKHADDDFRNYCFHYGSFNTRKKIINSTSMSDIEKYLTLNYSTCYGTKEAMEEYYETRKLTLDNFKGMGCSHLVKVDDIIKFFKTNPDQTLHQRADIYIKKYIDPEGNYQGFFNIYRHKSDSPWSIKKFKRKLWVVEILKGKPKTPVMIKILNAIAYPLKFIPKKDTLKMDSYTTHTFSIGSINGLKFEIQIPKKFSFK